MIQDTRRMALVRLASAAVATHVLRSELFFMYEYDIIDNIWRYMHSRILLLFISHPPLTNTHIQPPLSIFVFCRICFYSSCYSCTCSVPPCTEHRSIPAKLQAITLRYAPCLAAAVKCSHNVLQGTNILPLH